MWSSLWDVFYCDVGPPILVCWYTQSSVGTHGRMSGGNTYIYCLIDNTALEHNNDPPSCSTAQQYGRINRAAANNESIITIHLPADQSHNKNKIQLVRSGIKRSASTPRLQTKNNSSLSINGHHHHGRHHHHHHHHLCCVDGELLWWSHVLQADANPCDKQICPNNESRFPNNMRQISDE